MIKIMKVADIKPLIENPPSRVVDHAVADLVEYMKSRIETGKTALSSHDRLLIGCDGVLGDGHRRRAALILLGVEEVEVEFDAERTSHEIWRDRAHAKPLTSRQVSESGNLGLSREYFPKAQQRNADRLVQLAGEKGLKLVLNSGTSLGIHQALSRVVGFIGTTGDAEYNYKILDWLIRHKMQMFSRLAIESNRITAAKLKNSIDKNKPLQFT